ncbi:uncharacterized protein LOC144579682 [Callithrix jacchus]
MWPKGGKLCVRPEGLSIPPPPQPEIAIRLFGSNLQNAPSETAQSLNCPDFRQLPDLVPNDTDTFERGLLLDCAHPTPNTPPNQGLTARKPPADPDPPRGRNPSGPPSAQGTLSDCSRPCRSAHPHRARPGAPSFLQGATSSSGCASLTPPGAASAHARRHLGERALSDRQALSLLQPELPRAAAPGREKPPLPERWRTSGRRSQARATYSAGRRRGSERREKHRPPSQRGRRCGFCPELAPSGGTK